MTNEKRPFAAMSSRTVLMKLGFEIACRDIEAGLLRVSKVSPEQEAEHAWEWVVAANKQEFLEQYRVAVETLHSSPSERTLRQCHHYLYRHKLL